MKKLWVYLCLLITISASCVSQETHPTPTLDWGPATLPPTWTPHPTGTSPYWTPQPTITSTLPVYADIPDNLQVVFTGENTLYLWKKGELTELLKGGSVHSPTISSDGEWVVFHQQVKEDHEHPRDEIWAVRSEGGDLHRLLSTEEISSLIEDKPQLIINHLSWMPNNQQILFNTEEVIEGPPGSWYVFDLYQLDISGEIKTLANPGEGGDFYPSPDGRFIAIATTKRIGVIDLKNGTTQTLLEFDPLLIPTEAYSTPRLHWDRTSTYITTSIPPQHIYSPWEYKGELEQIWRLHITGEADLITEVDPVVGRPTIVKISPYGDYYFYFEYGKCGDGAMFTSHLKILPSGDEIFELPCTFNEPEWTPDGEHFMYEENLKWLLGSVEEATIHHLDYLDLPTAPNIYPPIISFWLNESYNLIRWYSPQGCEFLLASTDRILASIYKYPAGLCPRLDYSFP
jgi:Tol biopolymer transport system component